jgi:hypothetical protein
LTNSQCDHGGGVRRTPHREIIVYDYDTTLRGGFLVFICVGHARSPAIRKGLANDARLTHASIERYCKSRDSSHFAFIAGTGNSPSDTRRKVPHLSRGWVVFFICSCVLRGRETSRTKNDWCATIRKSVFATTMMAGGEESKAA